MSLTQSFARFCRLSVTCLDTREFGDDLGSMKIRKCEMVFGEKELAKVAEKHLEMISAPSLSISPDGLRFEGRVAWKALSVSFQSVWEFSVESGMLKAKLVTLRAGMIPAGLLKSMILGFITGAVNDPAIAATGDAITVDLNELLRKRGVQAKLTLDSVTCAQGEIVIQCSDAEVSLP